MSAATVEAQVRSFVLAQAGNRKIALPAESVIELVAPAREQHIPHRTPWLAGVILRRGRIVPVCDAGRLLGEAPAPANCFYLVMETHSKGARDWYAIPVAGECALVSPEETLPAPDRAEYVAEVFSLGDEQIEVLDLAKLIHQQDSAFAAASQEDRP